jgi:hypothetical protein
MKRSVFAVLLLVSISALGQHNSDDLRPFRIGLKVGAPNAASFEFEYVTPLLNNRVAPFVNYTGANFKVDQVDASLNIFEIGSNIYFSKNNEGRGLYGTFSYQNINANLEIEDYEAEDGSLYEGNAKTNVSYSGLNIKIGAKLGRKFFFRTELGYSIGDIPTQVFIEGNYEGEPASETISVENEIDDLPFIFTNGLPIFNIGFGFSF